MEPTTRTMAVDAPQISQPKETLSILYNKSTSCTASGKAPIPPGETIIPSVAKAQYTAGFFKMEVRSCRKRGKTNIDLEQVHDPDKKSMRNK